MQKRQLGQTGLAIAPMVFGGNVFGWTADEPTSFDLLDRFADRGFNAIDTADVYSAWGEGLSGGESEIVIGNWLSRRGRREDVVLMTKVGMWEPRKGLTATNVEAAVEDSLRRLRTDHIDVYFAHVDDADVPFEETLGAMSRLVESGKLRAIGASNIAADRLGEALQVSRDKGLRSYQVLQPLYNLYDRADYEGGLAGVAQRHGLGVVSYFSLASGFLTGKYRDLADVQGSARAGMLERYFDDRGKRLLGELLAVSDEVGAKPAQVALAWLIGRPGLTAPIASASGVAQLDELLAAVELKLPEAARARLDAASA